MCVTEYLLRRLLTSGHITTAYGTLGMLQAADLTDVYAVTQIS